MRKTNTQNITESKYLMTQPVVAIIGVDKRDEEEEERIGSSTAQRGEYKHSERSCRIEW